MTVELTPTGMTCNLGCGYCYQNQARDAKNFGPQDYDMEAMKRGLEQEDYEFTLHGGEPLLMDLDDLAEILRWGHDRYGQNGIQTNGTRITPEHVELFRRYNVQVGISVDGPGDLNRLRWAGSEEKTTEMTRRTHRGIEMVAEADLRFSVIVVLHAVNINPDQRGQFKAWLRELEQMGCAGIRFHPMQTSDRSYADEFQPTMEEYIEFYTDLHEFCRAELDTLRIDLVRDIRQLLLGRDRPEDHVTCVWLGCDPFHTSAVRGVDGEGNRSGCGRVIKDGVIHTKTDRPRGERYMALYQTPQDHGGCQGCRFFAFCKGQCPGEAIDDDWRNRSEFCELYKALFRLVEEELLDEGITPLSLSVVREKIERGLMEGWAQGGKPAIHEVLDETLGGPYYTHADSAHADHNDA